MGLIDELIKLIIENDLKLNSNQLKNKVEEIEMYSAFYNKNTNEADKNNGIMRNS